MQDEPKSQQRREDLQGQCLAAAMMAAARDAGSRRLAAALRTSRQGRTESFWLQQSTRGIVGECDALVAAPGLVQG